MYSLTGLIIPLLTFTNIFSSAASLQKFDALRQSPRDLEDANEIAFLHKFNVLYQNCFADTDVISYKLCPDHRGCRNGCYYSGEYTIDFYEFLDAFTELQLKAHQYKCEMIRENCEDDDNAACYKASGHYNECMREDQDNKIYKLQQYLGGCTQYEEYSIWVKPYCHDSINIYLGVYSDNTCQQEYNTTDWDADSMGEEFPEIPFSLSSNKPIIKDQCAKCREHGKQEDKNGGDDADDEDKVIEQCEQLYEDRTLSCETKAMYLNAGYDNDQIYPDESGCYYIQQLQTEDEYFQVQSTRYVRKDYGIALLVLLAGCVILGTVLGMQCRKSCKSTPIYEKENSFHYLD